VALDVERVLALWGPDPVHPSPTAYRLVAAKIAEKVENIISEADLPTPNPPEHCWQTQGQPPGSLGRRLAVGGQAS
jgi:hypothetical protein